VRNIFKLHKSQSAVEFHGKDVNVIDMTARRAFDEEINILILKQAQQSINNLKIA
jgi:hypothetical protein